MNILFIIFFGIFSTLSSWLIGYGISYKKKYTNDPDISIKNPVFGLNGAKCNKLPVKCGLGDIGVYALVNEVEGGPSKQDQYCSNTCVDKDTKFECLQGSNYVTREGDAEINVEDYYCVDTNLSNKFGACNKKYGGVMAWAGKGDVDQQGWECYCNWPQYAATENCRELNPHICGGKGVLEWDATRGDSPEDIDCICKEGHILMKSLEGKPDICVLKENAPMYNDTYKKR